MHFITSISVALATLSLVSGAPLAAETIVQKRKVQSEKPIPPASALADRSGPCPAPISYMIPYDQFQDYDPKFDVWWSFETDAGLSSVLEQTGSNSWSPPGSLWAWHVKPDPANLPADNNKTMLTATASIWSCITPGHGYDTQIAIGGVENKYPYDPFFRGTIDGNEMSVAYRNWSVCDYPWKCPGDYTADNMAMRTADTGERILASYTDTLVQIGGDRPSDMSQGEWMKVTFAFDWPVNKLNDGNPGVWLSRTWMKTWY